MQSENTRGEKEKKTNIYLQNNKKTDQVKKAAQKVLESTRPVISFYILTRLYFNIANERHPACWTPTLPLVQQLCAKPNIKQHPSVCQREHAVAYSPTPCRQSLRLKAQICYLLKHNVMQLKPTQRSRRFLACLDQIHIMHL